MQLRSYRLEHLALCTMAALSACSNQSSQTTASGSDTPAAGVTGTDSALPAADSGGQSSTGRSSTRQTNAGQSTAGRMRRTDADKSWSDAASLPKRPYLTLDEEQPLTPGEATLLEVPLWPSVWSVEPNHSIVVRISTQPNADGCADPLGVPVGCYPSTPMTNSLRDGAYALHRGAELSSLISLPLVKHGAFPTATSAASPTGNMSSPLPIDW